MLVLDDVQYTYQRELFRFDLTIGHGQIVSLMGPSGAGKSTLLALVAGFINPDQGDIFVGGESIVLKEPYQRPFSMLFQEHNLFAHLSVRDNISLGLHPGLKLTPEQKSQVEQAAQQVGVAEYLDRLPEHLSGGQRQRVALARCFVQPHLMWLLDEPFSALDPVLREEMLGLVKKLAAERGITVLMVTHHLSDAKAIATHFAFVAGGKIEAAGEISELSTEHPSQVLQAFVRAAG
ncbi:thiamine ABC transporter ATP-binding protein [Vibrio alginolyticus]|uniref:thiamine ABC transporter ATP-binding protein n=1 Tax=Vibrio sp. B1FLJ16 TaxID=2751178 RepID=UPI0015F68182|nr:thiamine ABC transporter ATP-binding protein [Vibrio sp. B1FLJ16]CAD7798231.1 Part of the ABC transporter complex ThiBPQ involved in thiamine import. Responsible for energy coupling to the transport system [Vibrio sp. B1FLJ16]CAE6882267.1 Part of the ABC transporter complex ThiBPQ involved in thiamine import. Responsible for energy coupling to the transport system [Vibrio sp. B1FLJ16]